MKMYVKLGCLFLSYGTLVAGGHAQTANCMDVGDEPHHQLLVQTQVARVFLLELPRLASTAAHCHSRAYLYVVPGEGRSSNSPENSATFSRDWRGGEARYVYAPVKHVVRNETSGTYRELIVETRRQVQYQAYEGNYDTDLLMGDWSSLKPTWEISVTRGSLTATKVQLAPGAKFPLMGQDHVLVAINDVTLKLEGGRGKAFDLGKEDVKVIRADEASGLINSGTQAARFVIVEF